MQVNFTDLLNELLVLFSQATCLHIIGSTMHALADDENVVEAGSEDPIFRKYMKKEVHETVSDMKLFIDENRANEILKAGVQGSREPVECDEGVFHALLLEYYGFQRKTVEKLTGKKVRKGDNSSFGGSIDYRDIVLANIKSIEGSTVEFEEFWSVFLEKKSEEEYRTRKRKRKTVRSGAILLISFSFLLFGAAFIHSAKPLLAGDISYGNAILRLLSRVRIITYREPGESGFTDMLFYSEAKEMLANHPGSFYQEPTYIPEGFRSTGFLYFAYEDGHAIEEIYGYGDTKAWMSVFYINRRNMDEDNFFIEYRSYEIITDGDVRFHLFSSGPSRFKAVFYLGDILVIAEAETRYLSMKKEDFIKFAASIINGYQEKLTD